MSFATFQSPFFPRKKGFEVFNLPSVLPDDTEALKKLLVVQQNAHTDLIEAIRQEAHNYVTRMFEQAILARQRMFGSSSEQMSAQSRLFDEAEVLVRIPVNVTADSGIVTGDSGERDRGSVLRDLILCRLAVPAGFPCLELACFE